MTNAPKDSHTFKNSQHGCGKQHHKFTFSRIFNQDTTQADFFENTMLSTVKEFVEGQNCLVFTYGVTNSGKTYTIQGLLIFSIETFFFFFCNCSGVIAEILTVVFSVFFQEKPRTLAYCLVLSMCCSIVSKTNR